MGCSARASYTCLLVGRLASSHGSSEESLLALLPSNIHCHYGRSEQNNATPGSNRKLDRLQCQKQEARKPVRKPQACKCMIAQPALHAVQAICHYCGTVHQILSPQEHRSSCMRLTDDSLHATSCSDARSWRCNCAGVSTTVIECSGIGMKQSKFDAR